VKILDQSITVATRAVVPRGGPCVRSLRPGRETGHRTGRGGAAAGPARGHPEKIGGRRPALRL